MIPLKPLGEKILVTPIEAAKETPGGIILAPTVKQDLFEAEVVAVGSGILTPEGKRVSLEVKVGDRVLYNRYGGSELNIHNQKYLVLSETDIIGVIL